jgi:Uma2 family endonuclease
MPESNPHRERTEEIKDVLATGFRRKNRHAFVGANQAIRWDEEHPKVGVDPDVYAVDPPPPEGADLHSLLLWKEGHHPPFLAVEVVSSHGHKDYRDAPAKYAAARVGELWVFDPELTGPHELGGPFRLQVWCRDAEGAFDRVYQGDGPYYSRAVEAWVIPVDEGRRLRVFNDRDGLDMWLTGEEYERIAKEQALNALERERKERESAQARIEELEALLKARGG